MSIVLPTYLPNFAEKKKSPRGHAGHGAGIYQVETNIMPPDVGYTRNKSDETTVRVPYENRSETTEPRCNGLLNCLRRLLCCLNSPSTHVEDREYEPIEFSSIIRAENEDERKIDVAKYIDPDVPEVNNVSPRLGFATFSNVPEVEIDVPEVDQITDKLKALRVSSSLGRSAQPVGIHGSQTAVASAIGNAVGTIAGIAVRPTDIAVAKPSLLSTTISDISHVQIERESFCNESFIRGKNKSSTGCCFTN